MPEDQHSWFETNFYSAGVSTNISAHHLPWHCVSQQLCNTQHTPHTQQAHYPKEVEQVTCKYTIFNCSHLKFSSKPATEQSHYRLHVNKRKSTYLSWCGVSILVHVHTYNEEITYLHNKKHCTYLRVQNQTSQFCSTSNLTLPVFSRFWIMLVSPSATLGV